MPNKSDLKRRNRELRHKIIVRSRDQKKKDVERKAAAEGKEMEKKSQPRYTYPEVILTILKRTKRIDPNRTVAAMDHYQAALVSYYKLKQAGFDKLKIGANSIHAWVEFEYDRKWWIFDPVAVRKRNLGLPVKKKSDTTEVEYSTLTRYFNTVSDYLDVYGKEIDLSPDECKIAAMEDEGLHSALTINYH